MEEFDPREYSELELVYLFNAYSRRLREISMKPCVTPRQKEKREADRMAIQIMRAKVLHEIKSCVMIGKLHELLDEDDRIYGQLNKQNN